MDNQALLSNGDWLILGGGFQGAFGRFATSESYRAFGPDVPIRIRAPDHGYADGRAAVIRGGGPPECGIALFDDDHARKAFVEALAGGGFRAGVLPPVPALIVRAPALLLPGPHGTVLAADPNMIRLGPDGTEVPLRAGDVIVATVLLLSILAASRAEKPAETTGAGARIYAPLRGAYRVDVQFPPLAEQPWVDTSPDPWADAAETSDAADDEDEDFDSIGSGYDLDYDPHDTFIQAMEVLALVRPWKMLRERDAIPILTASSPEPIGHACVLGHRLQRPGFAIFATLAEHQRFVRELSARRNHALPRIPALIALCDSALPSREPVPITTFEGGGLKVVGGEAQALLTQVAFLLVEWASGKRSARWSRRGVDGEYLTLGAPLDTLASLETARP